MQLLSRRQSQVFIMTETKSDKKSFIWIAVLHAAFIIYSLSTVLSKLASGEDFLSIKFCGIYGGMILLLGVYAVIWQQVLKHLPLVFAYANKAVTVIWGLIWGYILFSEEVTPNKLLGAVIVIAGIVLFSLGEKETDE